MMIEKSWRWLMLGTALWTVAIALMVAASTQDHELAASWALMFAMLGAVTMIKVIADTAVIAVSSTQVRVENVAKAMAEEAVRQQRQDPGSGYVRPIKG